ncbi:MAG: DUF3189 family protein [Bacillota bacterium]|nr:DUF3189 family protein [Bacillota bacterium]
MIVIYHCYGGNHASPVAAALHLGLLSPERPPSYQQLMALPLYDKVPPSRYGTLFILGRDAEGREVGVLAVKNGADLMERLIRDTLRLLGRNPAALVFVDVLPCINFWMRLGGFLSRQLGLVALGRPLVAWGTRLAFEKIKALVEEARRGGHHLSFPL